MTTNLQVARNLGATSATDLVKQAKFNNLRGVIRDYIDTAKILYPIGFESGAMGLQQFYDLIKDQQTNKAVYTVSVPVSLIRYLLGQIRNVRPEFCLQNFQTFNHSVDFTESEIGVAFYNPSEGSFDIVKKQHTIAQIAAIAAEKNEDLDVILRVVNFRNDVPQDVIIQEASKLFYREVKGINDTKEWEKLYHQVQCGEEDAITVMDFYKSIPGLTWQPVDFPFPLVSQAQYCCTKVSQFSKLIKYAINDGSLEELRQMIITLCQTVTWDREKPNKEVSVYLLRALYNFEKRLHPLIDDAMNGMGYHFSITEHIESFFDKKPIKMYLGSTSTDKKPWQHLVKVADRVNEALIESGQRDSPFFSLQSSKFVDAVYTLANPTMGKTKTESVDRETIEKYIKQHVRNFN
tara:strand:+ start:47 stop:1264 length:1218 start_codon:yes stop_codon:yes gene_type:complete